MYVYMFIYGIVIYGAGFCAARAAQKTSECGYARTQIVLPAHSRPGLHAVKAFRYPVW